jgi:hypothetical protein
MNIIAKRLKEIVAIDENQNIKQFMEQNGFTATTIGGDNCYQKKYDNVILEVETTNNTLPVDETQTFRLIINYTDPEATTHTQTIDFINFDDFKSNYDSKAQETVESFQKDEDAKI